MTASQYMQKADKLLYELRNNRKELHIKIDFCLKHNFDFEAQIARKEDQFLFEIITQIEMAFDIK
jgi:hypothetical protein